MIRFDRSGTASSDPIAGDVGDLTVWAEDGLAVLDAVGSEHCVVAGEGWGSHPAITLAVDHPGRVDRLILSNGFARLTQTDDYPHGLPADVVDRFVEVVKATWGTGKVIGPATPALANEYMDYCGRYERAAASPSVAAEMSRAMYASDVRGLLGRISCPALVLHTDQYRHISVAHTQYLYDNIRGAQLLKTTSGTYYDDLGAEPTRRYCEFLTGGDEIDLGERQLAVIVFSDIVESTTQLARQGDHDWTTLLESGHDVVVREVRRFGGRVIKQTGDGHVLTFGSPGAAISAVFEMRRAAHAIGMSLRFGAHMGEVEVRSDGDVAGIAVHTAARIAAEAAADEILVSRVVSDLLAGTGLELSDLGSHTLKGLPTPQRLFLVRRSEVHPA
jgi:class 3 adenylate cyclase